MICPWELASPACHAWCLDFDRLCLCFAPGAQTRAWHHGEEDPAVVDYIQSHFEAQDGSSIFFPCLKEGAVECRRGA